MVASFRPKILAIGSAKKKHGAVSASATKLPVHREAEVTLAASRGLLAPQALATIAVVPVDTAIKMACTAKKIR